MNLIPRVLEWLVRILLTSFENKPITCSIDLILHIINKNVLLPTIGTIPKEVGTDKWLKWTTTHMRVHFCRQLDLIGELNEEVTW